MLLAVLHKLLPQVKGRKKKDATRPEPERPSERSLGRGNEKILVLEEGSY